MANTQKFSEHELARRRDALRGFVHKQHPIVLAYQEVLKAWKSQPQALTKNDFIQVANALKAGDYTAFKAGLTNTKPKRRAS